MAFPTVSLGVKLALAALVLAVSFAALSGAQTLARPGWAGSGLNVQPWWKHAVIYEIDVRSFQDSNGDGVGDLKGILEHLDYLKSLGVDAILLGPLTAPRPVAEAASTAVPIDPAFGTVDDFDDLSREASRHNIRILLSLESEATTDSSLLPVARFWLSRGVAGFRLGAVSGDVLSSLQRLISTYTGRRILLTKVVVADAAQQPSGGLVIDSALLAIRSPTALSAPNIATSIRLAMEQSQTISRGGTPLFASDGSGVARSVDRFTTETKGLPNRAQESSIAKLIGTVLLLNRSASLVYLGQELGLHSASGEAVAMPWGTPSADAKPEVQTAPASDAAPVSPPSSTSAVPSERYVPYVAPKPIGKTATPPPCEGCKAGLVLDPTTAAGQDADLGSVLNFYRQLSQLHHGNSALRDGEQIMLNHDDLNALVWVRKTSSVTPLTPAVVVVCNLSTQPLVLAMKAELARLHLRGSFLRTILRSDDAMGSMHLEPVTVPPFGVYVGELRY